MESSKGMEYTLGQMEENTTVPGKMTKSMGLVSGTKMVRSPKESIVMTNLFAQ